MTEKIKEFVESLFDGVSYTHELLDFKEQIINSATARYSSLVAQGKTEQSAYNIAISGIGDISAKIDELQHKTSTTYTAGNTDNSSFYAEMQKTNEKKVIRKSISTVIWMLVVIAYFLVSFFTHAWHITWLIFLIGVAVEQIAKICFELKH